MAALLLQRECWLSSSSPPVHESQHSIRYLYEMVEGGDRLVVRSASWREYAFYSFTQCLYI